MNASAAAAASCLDLGEPLARHEHPGQRGAGLARVEVALRHAGGDRLLEVGVVEDHVGRLAAELQRHRFTVARGQLRTRLPGAGGAGEGDHVDVGVGGDRLADDRADAR